MFVTLKQTLSAFLLLLVLALVTATTTTNTPSYNLSSSTSDLTSTTAASSPPIYPPPGLIDSLLSMRAREALYQHDISTAPAFTATQPLPTAGAQPGES